MASFFKTAISIFRQSLGLKNRAADAPLSSDQLEEQAAFHRAVHADLDDDAPRLMYADWLDEQGGEARAARAEFIRFQCAHPRHEIITSHLQLIPAVYFPDVHPRSLALFHEFGASWEREFHTRGKQRGLTHASVAHRRWRRGFPDALDFTRWPEPAPVATSNVLPLLRSLTARIEPEDVERVLAASASGDLAGLTSLGLYGPGLSDEVLGALTGAPRLTRLSLRTGVVSTLGLGVLLASPCASQLVSLDLADCELSDVEIRLLAESSAVRGLRRLNLAGNPIGDDGATALSRSRNLKGLTSLDLTRTQITSTAAEFLRGSARLRRDCEITFGLPAEQDALAAWANRTPMFQTLERSGGES